MIVHCDTSFFVRQVVPGPLQGTAVSAAAELESRFGFVPITSLTRFEVIQALRLQAWLRKCDRSQGLPAAQVDAALNLFLAEIGTTYRLVEVELQQAERLSRGTPENGWRSFDLLHVASALASSATEFISFDKDQNRLASAEGLRTPFLQR